MHKKFKVIIMYEHLKKYSRIIVTGPQRSGTRIGAKIIAHDTGHTYIDEREIKGYNYDLLEDKLKIDNIVVQCPAMMNKIEKISKIYPDVLIVIMKRNINDIIVSQKRINWSEGSEKQELEKYGKTKGIISKIKYEHLDKIKGNINNLIEIEYEKLSEHILFLYKELRTDFKWSQTKRKETQ